MTTSIPAFDFEVLRAEGRIIGMRLQRDIIAAALRKRHAELVASCESSPTPTPAHKALVAELALLVFWVESLPCDPPPM